MNESPNTPPSAQGKAIGRYNEEEFRLLVDAVTEYAIFRLDPEGRVVSWNAGAEKIKGYGEQEIIGRHFSVFYTEEYAEAGRPQKGLESAARDGVWTDEGWRVRKNGERFWAHVTLTALFGDDGDLRGFAKVTRDMTERHEYEENLKQARLRAERENALLKLMETVAATANDARTLEQAMQVAIEAVCSYAGWKVGHAYRVLRAEEPRYVPMGIWHVEDADRYTNFCELTEETTFSAGAHLPGRVTASGSPTWIRDLLEDPDYQRASAATDAGLVGAMGVPVCYSEETAAVLEFYSDQVVEPDAELLEAMESVGIQLSRVAEREHARRVLRRSEQRYRRLFKQAQEGIAITTFDGKIIDANPACEDILGYSREELRAMNAADLYVTLGDREEVADQLIREGRVRNTELHLRHKNGEDRIVEASTTPRRAPDGEITSLQTFFRDVTERKRAAEALRESEAKFRALAEKALVGIAMLQEGVYTYANPKFAEITGYSREELIGRSPEDFYHPEDRDVVKEQVRKRLAGELEEAHYEARLVTKENEVRVVEILGSRLTYQGEPAIIGMVSDITDRKKAEEALRESEEKFRVLSEKAPVGILMIQDGRLEYANEALAHMYGYEREELLGRKYVDTLVHPDDRERVRDNIKLRLSGKQTTVNFRFHGLTRDGETLQIDAYGGYVEYRGSPAIIGMDIDVTDRVRLQREVLNMQEEERRRLGRDLHDGVASQLTSIALMVSLLSRRVEGDKLTIEDLPDELEQVQERITESCDDVRRLSRGLAPSGLSGDELPAALERLAHNTEHARFVQELDDLERLNDTAAAQLYWVAQEAVTNARKYAEADQITIHLRRDERALILEIEDDGKGFDGTSIENGSLGLRTMRYRAELLGGTFTIDTAPNEGTCVRCRVPL